MGQGVKKCTLRIHQVAGLGMMVAFTEAENREGKVDFGVDKGIKFTFEHVKFEVGQENTHELKAVRLSESETQEGVSVGLGVISI